MAYLHLSRDRQTNRSSESRGARVRVDNIHYELTEEDLDVRVAAPYNHRVATDKMCRASSSASDLSATSN